MQWQRNVDLGGVLVDIEYDTDRDIETGEWFFVEHGQILAGGVNISDALYLMGETKAVEEKIFSAIRASLNYSVRWLEAA
jgi:hypothetical protein